MSGGNVSIKDADDTIWITPGSTDKGAMKREEIVFRRKGSDEWEGDLSPSREWPFHTRVLEERPDCKAVLHAHSQTLVAFSVANQVPNTLVSYQAYQLCGTAAMSEYRMPGAEELADVIAAKIKDHDCVIMENHGVVVCGLTLTECYQKFEAFDFCARSIVKACMLGGRRILLSQEDIDVQNERRKAELKLWESTFGARPPVTTKECELRAQIIKFTRRSYNNGLMISCFGAFSARLSSTKFLITPQRLDRQDLDIEDLLVVDTSVKPAKVYGKPGLVQPSYQWKMIAEIYKTLPKTNSVILAEPINFGAFCITDMDFPTTINPETYLVCKDIGRITFRESLDYKSVAKYFEAGHHALIINNKGVVVSGDCVQKAYDMLEICESTTNVILDTKALGGFNLMTKDQVDELDRNFFPEKEDSFQENSRSSIVSARSSIFVDDHALTVGQLKDDIKLRQSFLRKSHIIYGSSFADELKNAWDEIDDDNSSD
jgi:L-fuculose-phosphate aldolase